MTLYSASRVNGLVRISFIPSVRNAARSSGRTLAVRATIGAARLAPSPARMAWVALRPSITGIEISIRIRS